MDGWLLPVLPFPHAQVSICLFSAQDLNVFFASAVFLALSVALGSHGRGVRYGLSYIRLTRANMGWLSILGWSAAALLCCLAAAVFLSVALAFLGMLDTEGVASKLNSLSPFSLFFAFSISPLAEEAMFRGYLLRKIGEVSKSASAGAALSSLLFAAMHLSYGSSAEMAAAFMIGLILCFFTIKSRSLVPAVLAHCAFNFLSILFNVVLA
ncbi:MAG: CPBP family intramembrane metalloprotease [Candidatus Micrarchaeota archaeon]|nr:CPBP family intramembrane metalloprotease [Candidatus Micrarchaeota archaeon]